MFHSYLLKLNDHQALFLRWFRGFTVPLEGITFMLFKILALPQRDTVFTELSEIVCNRQSDVEESFSISPLYKNFD